MSLNFLSTFLTTSVTLIPSVPSPTGLGNLLYLLAEDSSGNPNLTPNPTSVTLASEVDALLASNDISAQAADDIKTALSNGAPIVYLAGYDTNASAEDPGDALDLAVASNLDFGVIACEERTDAALEAVGTWLAGARYEYMAVLQSDEATLLTSGKPAGLSNCEKEEVVLVFHDTDSEPAAAALAGKLSGLSMITRPDGSLGLQQNVTGVVLNATTLTTAQEGFLRGNGGISIMQRSRGAGATAYDFRGVNTYGDAGFSGIATTVFAVARMKAAVLALIGRHTVSGRPLKADATGRGELRNDLVEALKPMSDVNHFVPGEVALDADNTLSVEEGFYIDVTSSGTTITANVYLFVAPEADAIVIPVTVQTEAS